MRTVRSGFSAISVIALVFLYRFRRQGRVLDVGCGWGALLLALDRASWDRYGLEAMPGRASVKKAGN